MSLVNVFGFFSCICYFAYFVFFTLLHLLNKEYNYKQHALSDYAIGSTKNLFVVYSFIGNIGALFLALVFILSRNSNELFSQIGVFIILMIVCRILLTLFKTNIEGSKLTASGLLHYLFAIGNFTFLYLVIDTTNSHVLNHSSVFPTNLVNAYGILVTVVLVLVCITMFKPLRKLFGIIERLYILITAFWFFIIAFLFMVNGKI